MPRLTDYSEFIVMRKYLFLLGFYIIILHSGYVYAQDRTIDSLLQRIDKVEGEEKIRTYIGLSYHYLRINVDSSLFFSETALNYSELTNNLRGVARAKLMIGSGHNAKGEYSLAINSQISALEIFKELGDTSAMGITYNNLGTNYHDLGNYSLAIDQYKNSINIAKKLSNTAGLYYATNNIGIIYEDWQKYQLALEYYSEALKIANEINDKSYIGITLQNIGVIYQKMGEYEKALDYIGQSLDVSTEIGDSKGIYNTFLNKGIIYQEMNKNTEAVISFEKALEISIEANDKKNIADASLKLGSLYAKEKEYTRAYSLLNNALNLAREIEDITLTKEAYKSLADYYQNTNSFERAYYNYLEYATIKDTIFNRDSRKEISEMQTLYELDKKEKEIEIQDLKISQQQSQFYYIISGIIVLIIVSYLLFNRYKLKQKHVRIELEKKNIEIEQRLLRTQMNPHFIFNSLNSINSFITDNNSDSAQAFLSKFARLMRYILENSRKTMVPLEDEVNTLRLNMELEQLRFDHKFDFEIAIDDNIDPEFTYIPPMLIQPFIENAIIHGLSLKENGGLLKLGFELNGELMHCFVEDNGVGRELSASLKSESGKSKHRSLGMQVTKERLEILNEKTKEKVFFEITDLKDEEGKPAGTRVDLKIPFEVE